MLFTLLMYVPSDTTSNSILANSPEQTIGMEKCAYITLPSYMYFLATDL